ncbi:6445_t:CDS:2 [Cetraspora pellucida]|uniref:6445_t:CDS:1 n=1 Tax=Cetraspora pellucida TaxID=1433469 RepID=A0A9N9PD41_9GLOM|nr:6445_t:CDS:2 [Cetraspora pellucida]
MVSHIALLVVMTIRFKYFLSIEQPVQTFISRDIIFISGKFVIEDSESCFTVAYLSIVNNNNPDHEFDMTSIPLWILTIIDIINKDIDFAFTRLTKKNVDVFDFSSATIDNNHIDLDLLIIEIKSDNDNETLEDEDDEQKEEL